MTASAANAARSRDDDVMQHVVEGLENDLDDGASRISVDEVVTALNDRGFGVLCALIGALAAIPIIGGLPGVTLLTAVLVLLVAGQYLAGRRKLWMPSALGRLSVEWSRFEKGLAAVRPYAERIDRLIEPRLDWLVRGDGERRLIAGVICLLALTMFPLALVPWGVFPSALAITAFGIAITGRDGAFALAGYVLTAVAIGVLYAFWGVISSML
jgi:hypothetical protein